MIKYIFSVLCGFGAISLFIIFGKLIHESEVKRRNPYNLQIKCEDVEKTILFEPGRMAFHSDKNLIKLYKNGCLILSCSAPYSIMKIDE